MLVTSTKEAFTVTVCSTFLNKILGLMFSKKPSNDGLLFIFDKEVSVSLHMFFVFFPIDIVYLNANKKILEIKKNVHPFTPYIQGPAAKYLLELKDARTLTVGDHLRF